MNEYFSIEREAENEIVIEHSRFIAFAKKTDDENQAKDFIATIKKRHSLATHNCYAYVVESGLIRRFSDDGEPSKTAGAPILEAILSLNLNNVTVVVTRYFGGIKLGAGGLVRAYSQSAASVLKSARVLRYVLCGIFCVQTDYNDKKLYDSAIKEVGAKIINVEYGETVKIEFCLEMTKINDLNDVFAKWLKSDISLVPVRKEFIGDRESGR